MTVPRAAAIGAFGLLCATYAVAGQSFSTYRQFELGSGVAAVAAKAGIAASEAKTVHQRPAVLQDLEWRPSRWTPRSSMPSTDPVEKIVFNFYNDQLFRVIVDYGSHETEGMTPPDLVDAIAAVYGAPITRAVQSRTTQAASQADVESGSPVARWGDAAHTIVLYQTSSVNMTFRLILTDVARAQLAAKADTEARRLDDREAPQRELAREKKAREDERDAAAKARLANKGAFQP